MNETLKQCPFCGSDAEVKSDENKPEEHFCVECKSCWCVLGGGIDEYGIDDDYIYSTRQDAIDAWNTRIA